VYVDVKNIRVFLLNLKLKVVLAFMRHL